MEPGGNNVERPIHIFWHVYVGGRRQARCISIIQRQFAKLESSGLLERAAAVHIGYIGKEPFPCEDVIGHPKVQMAVQQERGHEDVTTRALKEFCDGLDHNCAVLYMHTRGATRRANTPAEDWTLMMEHFTIERWRKAVSMLSGFHTCGCEMWSHRRRVPPRKDFVYHYSGNFWWARSEYIKLLSLPPDSDLCRSKRYMGSEDWLLELAGRRFDKTEFGVLHRTSLERYQRGSINSYVHRYPAAYYRSGSETPDGDLGELLAGTPASLRAHMQASMNNS